MQFESHMAVWFFWVLPVLLVMFLLLEKKRRKALHAFYPEKDLPKRLPLFSKASHVVRFVLFLCAILFLGIALLKPYSDFEMREIKRKGVDLFFLVDVSRSMLAQDVKPDRMARARREIVDFLAELRGDRVGLIAFAGDSFTFVPLTGDYKTFKMFVGELKPDAIPVQGTDIKGAIQKAVKSFKKTQASRAIVLITDGEDSIGLDSNTLKYIKELGVKIYIIGIGSDEGAPVVLSDGHYLKDDDDKVVLTKLNETALQNLAIETGGGYVRSVSGDLDLEQIYFKGIKKSFKDTELDSLEKKLPVYEFQLPLFIAIILLMFEILITNKKRFWLDLFKPKAGVNLFFMLMVVGFLAVSQSAMAFINPFVFEKANDQYDEGLFNDSVKKYQTLNKTNPNHDKLNYNLGNNYYRLGEFEKAEKAFTKALSSDDKDLQKKSLYNLGNVKFKQNKLKEALGYYEKALALDEDYEIAKLNHEFVMKKLEEQKQKQQNEDTKDEDTKDDQNKQDKDQQKNEDAKDEDMKDDQNKQDKDQQKNEDTKDEDTKDDQDKQDEQQQNQDKKQDQDQKNEDTKDDQNKQDKDQDQNEHRTPNTEHRDNPEFKFDNNAKKWLESISDEPGDALKYMIQQQMDVDKKFDKKW